MLDRKNYPSEKLFVMADAYFTARQREDRGSRDGLGQKDWFMWAALEAGERWDMENSPDPEVRRKLQERDSLKATILSKKRELANYRNKLNEHIKEGNYLVASAVAKIIHDGQEEVERLEEELNG